MPKLIMKNGKPEWVTTPEELAEQEERDLLAEFRLQRSLKQGARPLDLLYEEVAETLGGLDRKCEYRLRAREHDTGIMVCEEGVAKLWLTVDKALTATARMDKPEGGFEEPWTGPLHKLGEHIHNLVAGEMRMGFGPHNRPAKDGAR